MRSSHRCEFELFPVNQLPRICSPQNQPGGATLLSVKTHTQYIQSAAKRDFASSGWPFRLFSEIPACPLARGKSEIYRGEAMGSTGTSFYAEIGSTMETNSVKTAGLGAICRIDGSARGSGSAPG